ncbi:MAG: hypothetical protein RIA69_08835 [Cyclobacteriaceae bacterium]
MKSLDITIPIESLRDLEMRRTDLIEILKIIDDHNASSSCKVVQPAFQILELLERMRLDWDLPDKAEFYVQNIQNKDSCNI